jgi:hypothetical protein
MPTSYPVALFAHRRPALLAMALDALRREGVPRICAWVDGVRGPADEAGHGGVIDLLRSIDWADVTLVARPANVGVYASVCGGLDDFFSTERAGVIVEEDIRLAPGAYRWLCEGLDRYAADPRVGSINAWTHPRVTPAGVEAPWWCVRGPGWGWATWRRTWDLMREPVESLVARLAHDGVDLSRCGDDIVPLARHGHWDGHFTLAGFGARVQNLYPPRSLADHLGAGADATHLREMGRWRAVPAAAMTEHWPWPADVSEHPDGAELWRRAVAADAPPRDRPIRRLRRVLGRGVRRIARSWRRWPDALLLRLLLWSFRARGRPAFDDELPKGSTPVRELWNDFLRRHQDAFFGHGLEIGNANTLTALVGEQMSTREVLDVVAGPGVQHVADLQNGWTMPESRFNVFVNQFTVHLLADDRAALWHSLRTVRAEGTLFVTFPCASQVAYGFDYGPRHVDVVRSYTLPGVRALLAELGIDEAHAVLEPLGGAGALASYLLGVPVEALPRALVARVDAEAPLLVAARITKPVRWAPQWSPSR